jgi:hypothetical protein
MLNPRLVKPDDAVVLNKESSAFIDLLTLNGMVVRDRDAILR